MAADYTIYPTDKIEFDVESGGQGVRLTQVAGGEESVIWIDATQIFRVIEILEAISGDME